MLDQRFELVLAHLVGWHEIIEPFVWCNDVWRDGGGVTDDDVLESFWHNFANELAGFGFMLVEEFETIALLAVEVTETICEIKFGAGASDSHEEYADFLVGRVASMADVFEVAWERKAVVITASVAPVAVIYGNEEDVVEFQTFGGVDGFELHGRVGFVIWRLINDFHFGIIVGVYECAEIGEAKLFAATFRLSQ